MSPSSYFNHKIHVAYSAWEQWEFRNSWWRLYAQDRRWTPPYYPALRRALNTAQNSHLARMAFGMVHVDAIRRRQRRSVEQLRQPPTPMVTALEVALAAAVAVVDPRRHDRTAHLSLLHVFNDRETLRFFLNSVGELVRDYGRFRFLTPTGLSPHLGSGMLQDRWNLWPPLHTPYNPPYLPELLSDVMNPVETRRLYHLSAHADDGTVAADATVKLVPLAPQRLAGDLLPLLAAACENRLGFPPPDAAEAAFLLRWLGEKTLSGRLALVDGDPAGFVLLQPDLAPRLRRANGGRSLLWRLWWQVVKGRPAHNGRLLFGAVLPKFRRRGIGRRLLQQTVATARARGWETVTVGPLPEEATAVALLSQFGARPRQTYAIYEYLF